MKTLYTLSLLFIIALASCKVQDNICSPRHERKAKKLMSRAMDKCDYAVAQWAAYTFPIREFVRDSIIYKQGTLAYLPPDTVLVNCDSIVRYAPVTFNRGVVKTRTVKVPCPPVQVRVDTFYRDKETTKESTARLSACMQERDVAQSRLANKQQEYAVLSKKVTWLMWLAAIGWGILIVPNIFRWIVKLWQR